mgnify:CR=1 FL=1
MQVGQAKADMQTLKPAKQILQNDLMYKCKFILQSKQKHPPPIHIHTQKINKNHHIKLKLKLS